MEIKCNICGTINDGSTNFCKGCFQKLDENRKVESLEPKIEPIIEVPIEEEKEKEVPWVGDNYKEAIELEPIDGEISDEETNNQEFTNIEINNPIVTNNEEMNWDIPLSDEQIDNSELKIPEELNEEEKTTDEILEQSMDETENSVDWEVPTIEEEKPLVEEIENNEVPVENSWDEPNVEESISNEEITEKTTDEILEQTMDETENSIDPKIPTIEEEKPLVEEIENNEVPVEDSWDEPNVEESKEITKNDDWNQEVKEEPEIEEKKPKFILKFLFIYLIGAVILFGGLLFTMKFITGMFDESTAPIVEFIIYRLAMLLLLLLTTKLTFLKSVPNEDKLNKVTFSVLSFVAIPGILIQLFILGFIKDTKVLLFTIGIILAVITLEIFFSYIRSIIRKQFPEKKEDKVLFIYGIVSIVIVVVLLGFGMFARTKNLDMPKINFLYDIFHNEKRDNELITNFVYEVEKTILRNQTDDSNYIIPTTLTDVSYATYNDVTPDEMKLTINENGGVVSGTITYRGITYQYSEGTIKE